jgi:uncharacterized paraquat-inducible protein A
VSLEPSQPVAGAYEHRRAVRGRLGTGTLACPECDAPVHITGPLAATDALGCPYCGHDAAVRDFLSLSQPARPARVAVRVAHRTR